MKNYNLKNLDKEDIDKISNMAKTMEFHPPNFNYMGAGTNIEKRLLTGEFGVSVPTSLVDSFAMKHDLHYMLDDPLAHQHADRIFMDDLLTTIKGPSNVQSKIGNSMIYALFSVKSAIEKNIGGISKSLSGDPAALGTTTPELNQRI